MAAGIAGCGGGGQEDTPTAEETAPSADTETETEADETEAEETEPPTETETDTPVPTAEEAEIIRGGRPVFGQAQPPQHLNWFKAGNAYGEQIMEKVHVLGAIPKPGSGERIPWGYESWELNVDNIGTSSPTITAKMREGLTFHDGKKITAKDAVFTYNYQMENQTAGDQPSSAVESVEFDKPNGLTVNYFLSEKDAFWLSDIVGQVFAPKHIWKNVSDYKKYSPREEGGMIGGGILKFRDTNWPNWIELDMRPREEIPYNKDERYSNWLDPKGPFVDGIRYQLFKGRTALFQSVMDGDTHKTLQTVTEDQAVQATKSDDLEVLQNESSGFEFHNFNQRRVPFDDVAFRQFLWKSLNENWLVEDLHKGIGVKAGTYHTSTRYKGWRPPEPEEADYEYEGIELPNYDFPSDTLAYKENIRQQDIDALRDFLINHPDAKYDYSLGETQADPQHALTPDGKSIYIDGKPIGEVHTNNQGEPGQGPLEMSQGPPPVDPLSYPRADAWIKALKRIGVPIRRKLEPWETQYIKVYINEDFDMYEQSWPSLDWPQTHHQWMFHSSFADLELNQDVAQWNSAAYTGADDLIGEHIGMMDHEKRRPIVKKAHAKIYADAAQMNSSTPIELVPVHKSFTGWITSTEPWAGVGNKFTVLNLRKNPDYQ